MSNGWVLGECWEGLRALRSARQRHLSLAPHLPQPFLHEVPRCLWRGEAERGAYGGVGEALVLHPQKRSSSPR